MNTLPQQTYYFTFGQAHYTVTNERMADYYVRVEAESYSKARALFIEHFTSKFMDRPERFAFQYDEEDFSPNVYPLGEYAFISEDEFYYMQGGQKQYVEIH